MESDGAICRSSWIVAGTACAEENIGEQESEGRDGDQQLSLVGLILMVMLTHDRQRFVMWGSCRDGGVEDFCRRDSGGDSGADSNRDLT